MPVVAERRAAAAVEGRGLKIAKGGRLAAESTATIEAADGERVTLKAGQRLEVEIEVGGHRMKAAPA